MSHLKGLSVAIRKNAWIELKTGDSSVRLLAKRSTIAPFELA